MPFVLGQPRHHVGYNVSFGATMTPSRKLKNKENAKKWKIGWGNKKY